ncbi:MAG: hypothetical protein M1820_001470 [Bogoriella megaspora]|nr:MAG: hypothetical protein M1820_001470 [Bogoriella megaspora]
MPTALITGCSAGSIGSALALEFVSRGYHVFASVRDPAKASHLSSNASVSILTLDVTLPSSIRAAVDTVKAHVDKDIKTEGNLDVLVNNAGIGYTGPLLDINIEEAKRLYDTNVWSILSMTQAFAPMLIKAKGKVVNISSVGGLLTLPWHGLYSSSKAAVTQLSETLRLELASLGVTVVTGMLGSIETNFHDNDPWKPLPEDSVYKSIEDKVRGRKGPKSEKVEVFARNFVGDVLGGASGQVWRGAVAQTSRTMGYHAPMGLLDYLLVKGSGLDTLAKQA